MGGNPIFSTVQIALLLIAACSSQASSDPPPTVAPAPPALADQAGKPDPVKLAKAAEAAFDSFRQLDYKRPMLETPRDIRPIAALYLKACEAGDRRSCWISEHFVSSKRAAALVEQNCIDGDLLSCRAIPINLDMPNRRLLGWAGLTIADVPRQDLERECTAGFPRSCFRLSPKPLLGKRTNELLAVGCREGIMAECSMLQYPFYALKYQQTCKFWTADCSSIVSDDPIVRRDSLEYGCQYASGNEQLDACSDVRKGYERNDYPEPVAGRARELAAWAKDRKRI